MWYNKPCIISSYSKDKDGYANLGIKHYGYSKHHRKVYAEFHNVELNSEQFVCHHCDNPGCIEIEHLFLGMAADNMEDQVMKDRHVIGIKNGRAKIVEEDVRAIRKLYKTTNLTQQELANKFGVNQRMISNILLRKNWGHVA